MGDLVISFSHYDCCQSGFLTGYTVVEKEESLHIDVLPSPPLDIVFVKFDYSKSTFADCLPYQTSEIKLLFEMLHLDVQVQ